MDHKPKVAQLHQTLGAPHAPRMLVEAHITHLAQADACHLAKLVPAYFPAQSCDQQTIHPIDVLACDADAFGSYIFAYGLPGTLRLGL